MAPSTILDMLDGAVLEFGPEPLFFKAGDRGFEGRSCAELRAESRAFAAWLLSRGLRPGDAVALLGEGSPEWMAAELAAMAAGCVTVPLSVRLLAGEIPFRVSHSGAKAFVVSAQQLDKALEALAGAGSAMPVVVFDPAEGALDAACARSGYPRESVVDYAGALAGGRAAGLDGELEAVRRSASPDDTVTISYTSGTTGDPKGIMLSHRNYLANVEDGGKMFDTRGLSTLVILPVDHSFAHTVGIFSAIRYGIRLYFVDSRGGGIGILRAIPRNLLEVEPSFLMTVPALSGNFMRKIIAGVEAKGGLLERAFKAGLEAGTACVGNGFGRSPGATLRNRVVHGLAKTFLFGPVKRRVFGRNIRFLVGGGALLDLKQQLFFAAFGLPVYQGYGLTEAAPVISSNTPSRRKYGTSGWIAPSEECTVRRPDGSICAVGETGEVVVRGENVMKGYFRNPEATARALRDGWLWTGDLAYFDADGFLVVVGREKALLIAEDGEKYSPETIEEAVESCTNLFTAVMAYNDMRKSTIALVTLDEERLRREASARGLATAEAALEFAAAEFFRHRKDPRAGEIPRAWLPSAFMIVPGQFSDRDGTLNSTMKLVRRRVAELHSGLVEYAYTAEGSRPGNPRNLEAVRAVLGS